MLLRMFRSKICQFNKIQMWLHSDHNHNNSKDRRIPDTTTVELGLADKYCPRTIPATGRIKLRVPMLPEMINFVYTARF
jgi:hypothetical protein